MTTEIAHTPNGNTLYAKLDYGNMPSGLYKFLIPAGTWQWRVSVQTYNDPAPAKALAQPDLWDSICRTVAIAEQGVAKP